MIGGGVPELCALRFELCASLQAKSQPEGQKAFHPHDIVRYRIGKIFRPILHASPQRFALAYFAGLLLDWLFVLVLIWCCWSCIGAQGIDPWRKFPLRMSEVPAYIRKVPSWRIFPCVLSSYRAACSPLYDQFLQPDSTGDSGIIGLGGKKHRAARRPGMTSQYGAGICIPAPY